MIFRLLALVALAISAASSSIAAPASTAIDAAVLKAQADMEDATSALLKQRAEISLARKALADEWAALQAEVRESRLRVQRMRVSAVQDERERTAKADALLQHEEEYRYLLLLANEYRRSIETRMNESEAVQWRGLFGSDDRAELTDENVGEFSAYLSGLLSAGLDFGLRRHAGYTFPGRVLEEKGIELDGAITVVGPLAYFASDDARRAGLVVTRFGVGLPALEENLPDGARASIVALTQGHEAIVPVDVSGGDALKIRKAKVSLVAEWQKGGHVMIALLLVALIATVLALWKWVDLMQLRLKDQEQWRAINEQIKSENIEAARASAARAVEPLKSLYIECIACRKASRAQLEELLHEHIISFVPRLERHLGTLAVLGGIAPLLGLLGTVTGMIHTFQMVTLFGSGDAKLLSGGISEALITTKYGLIIAVPVLLAHAFLARRAREQLAVLEETAIGMVNDLKGRGEE